MPCSDAEQRNGRPLRLTSALLPVAQGVHAYLDRAGELVLGEPDELSQSCDVLTGFESTLHQPLAQAGGDRVLHLFVGQFGDVGHRYGSMCER